MTWIPLQPVFLSNCPSSPQTRHAQTPTDQTLSKPSLKLAFRWWNYFFRNTSYIITRNIYPRLRVSFPFIYFRLRRLCPSTIFHYPRIIYSTYQVSRSFSTCTNFQTVTWYTFLTNHTHPLVTWEVTAGSLRSAG